MKIEVEHLLVVDDDPVMSAVIEGATNLKTFRVANEDELKAITDQLDPTCVFVDVYLEKGEIGLELIPGIKELYPNAVIIAITAGEDPNIISEALSMGADDFIQKPIRPEELRARMTARRQQLDKQITDASLKYADIEFNSRNGIVVGPRGKATLSSRESTLLEKLISARGTVVSKNDLRAAGWGDFKVSNNALDRKLHALRKILSSVSDNVELKAQYGSGLWLREKDFDENKRLAEDFEILQKL